MKRVPLLVVFLLAFALIFTHETQTLVQPAAATPLCGTIAPGTILTASNPYDMCAAGISIPAGVSLTIQPGAILQFEPGNGDRLNVNGALSAAGTAAQPILFTGAPIPGRIVKLDTTNHISFSRWRGPRKTSFVSILLCRFETQ